MVPVFTEAPNAYADCLLHLPFPQAEHSIEGFRTRGFFPFSFHGIHFIQELLFRQAGYCPNRPCALQLIWLISFVRPSACHDSPPVIAMDLPPFLVLPSSHAASRFLCFLARICRALWASHGLLFALAN